MYKLKPEILSKGTFSKFTLRLFLIISIYLVMPIIDLPLLGLSLSAPLFFLVAAESVFRPPISWSSAYRPYIVLAGLIGVGIFLSMTINGLSSGGVDIDNYGIETVIHYIYWLFIFIIVAYVVTVGKLGPILSQILGWSIFVLAILRWSEVAIYGNLGAWIGTHLMTENSYGFQFSAFSPFLLMMILSEKTWKKWVAIVGNILLWGAAAINGSRSSWIAILLSIIIFLLILLL
jgi:general stress protein CsbA